MRVFARTLAEAKSITGGLKRKNRFTVSEPKAEFLPATLEGFKFDIDAGPDHGKLCLKMCSAMASLLPRFSPADIGLAVRNLRHESDALEGVAKDGRTHASIDNSRPPLAHVIYIERNLNPTCGIVQFFGAMQFYCTFGEGSPGPACAMLGVLDSTTGEEAFREADLLNLASLSLVSSREFPGQWSKKLFDQIREKGCADLSDVQITFKPACKLTLSSASTTDIWPFARIPNTPG